MQLNLSLTTLFQFSQKNLKTLNQVIACELEITE
ncbi:hypothetical protein ARNL5_02503 [Anaerolineae bacterium]|nr:hypothetical protein ARNL5_02503 [Anaerolineae bacterium]